MSSGRALGVLPPGTLSAEMGYEAQQALLARRLEAGERQVGVKVAFTNERMLQRLGLAAPATGHLTDAMQVANGGAVGIGGLRPRAEPEIALLLARDIDADLLAQADVDLQAIEAAVRAYAPAIEIVGSRFVESGFDLGSVLADNASAHAFALGPWRPVQGSVDWTGLMFRVERNGELVAHGSSQAILGHPLRSLREAARIGIALRQPLRAGYAVLAGSATDPVGLTAGDWITVTVDGLGEVSVTIKA